MASCSNYKADITMGVYPQSESGDNKAISWDILKKEDDKALIVSHYILDSKRFDDDSSDYKESEIRAWLNDEFYNNAFTSEEKAKILTTSVVQGAEDKLFLLSTSEVMEYYPKHKSRIAPRTKYSKAQGLFDNETSNGCYWLRTANYDTQYEEADIIIYDGTLAADFVYLNFYGVRPACWVAL